MKQNNTSTNAKEKKEKIPWDYTLRPKKFDDYIGQNKVKENLRIFIGAAKKRKESLDHVLLHGAAGLGKTTLAYIIAKEMGANIKISSGPAIERAGDLAAILSNLEEGDILFIDEIHRINTNIEEVLYPALEEFMLDIIVGKGPSAKTLRLNLPRFTLIGATTKLSQISSPLRDRFGVSYRLNFYELHETAKIIERSSAILKFSLDNEIINAIAARSRNTPRIANRILKRVRDYAEMHNIQKLGLKDCLKALTMLDIDDRGLDIIDRKILETIIKNYRGGPVGLHTIAAALAEDVETIEEIYEPFLLQMGFIERTPRGRMATDLAYAHLKKSQPKTQERKLQL